MPSIIGLLVWLLIFGIVAGVGYYIIGNLIPPPIQKVAYAIFYLILAIVLIYLLMSLVGPTTFPRLR